jgi:hypothetical protein
MFNIYTITVVARILSLNTVILGFSGIFLWVRGGSKALLRSIGIALVAGGVLSTLLPLDCITAGVITNPIKAIILGYALVGASFAYIAHLIFSDRQERAIVKAMLEADALLPTPLPRPEESEPSRFERICILLKSGDAKAQALALQMNAALIRTAAEAGQRRQVDYSHNWRADPALAHLPAELPVGWQNDDQIQMALRQSALLERDRAFLSTCWPDMSVAISAVAEACAHQEIQLRALRTRWTSLSPAQIWIGVVQPPGTTRPPAAIDTWAANETRLAELAKLAAVAPSGADVADALKLLLCWPDRASATFLLQACVTPLSQVYASQSLAARAGTEYTNWGEWEAWLKRAGSGASESRAAAIRLIDEFRPELATIWLSEQPGTPDPALETALRVAVAERARQKTDPIEFAHRWRLVLTPTEIDSIVSSPIPRQVHIPSVPEPIPPPLPERPPILPLPATPLRRMQLSRIAWIVSITFGIVIALYTFRRESVAIELGPIYPTTIPLMDKTDWRFKFVAKITNNTGRPLILPAFRIYIPHAFQSAYETCSPSCIPSGSSYYQFFGGECPITDRDRLGTPKVIFDHNDWYATQAYAESQISNVSRMKIDVQSWQVYDNGIGALQIQFINNSGIKVNSVDGTALFLGADGAVLDGGMFDMNPGPNGRRELDISDVPNAKQAIKCIIQINSFRSPSQPIPAGLPPGPSVR